MTVTYGRFQHRAVDAVEAEQRRDLEGLRILCLDNDPLILQGMEQLLVSMGAAVTTAAGRAELSAQLGAGPRPDIVLADYHLNDNDTGLEAVLAARREGGAADTPASSSAPTTAMLSATGRERWAFVSCPNRWTPTACGHWCSP